MWGNDPEFTQKKVDEGCKPSESWINPEVEELRISLGGKRPSWGWNGRMNGPADNSTSACSSCHSLAQKRPDDVTDIHPSLVPPKAVPPENDAENMKWRLAMSEAAYYDFTVADLKLGSGIFPRESLSLTASYPATTHFSSRWHIRISLLGKTSRRLS